MRAAFNSVKRNVCSLTVNLTVGLHLVYMYLLVLVNTTSCCGSVQVYSWHRFPSIARWRCSDTVGACSNLSFVVVQFRLLLSGQAEEKATEERPGRASQDEAGA